MKTYRLLTALLLPGILLLAGCGSLVRVGDLRTESQSIEPGNARSVRVEINLGAGDLKVTAGTENLLEADFTYNVARLRPVVEYADGTLVVVQPETGGLPVPQDIKDFRNEWDLRLHDNIPIDLRVDVGGGGSDLRVGNLLLTRLDVHLGAGTSMLDLNGDWPRDLEVTIDAGATDLTVRLPRDVGVRVEVDRGPTMINASELLQDENVYTNDAYGESEVTLRIGITTGIGWLTLDLVDGQ